MSIPFCVLDAGAGLGSAACRLRAVPARAPVARVAVADKQNPDYAAIAMITFLVSPTGSLRHRPMMSQLQ